MKLLKSCSLHFEIRSTFNSSLVKKLTLVKIISNVVKKGRANYDLSTLDGWGTFVMTAEMLIRDFIVVPRPFFVDISDEIQSPNKTKPSNFCQNVL